MNQKKEINIQIGREIKIARENRKLTQEQFAEAIDVSTQYVSELERGVVGVSVATLKRICTVLGVSSDRILFGGDSASMAVIGEQCRSLSGKQMSILSDIVEKYVEAIHSERFREAEQNRGVPD